MPLSWPISEALWRCLPGGVCGDSVGQVGRTHLAYIAKGWFWGVGVQTFGWFRV